MRDTPVSDPLRAKGGDTGPGGETLIVQAIPILEPGARTGVSTTDVRAGIGIGHEGDPMFTLQSGKQHGVAYAFAQITRDEVRLLGGDGQIAGCLSADTGMKQTTYIAQSVALRGRDGGATAELGGDAAYALRAAAGGGSDPYVLAPIPLNPNVLRSGEAVTPSPDAEGRVRLRKPSFGVGQPGDPADTLQAATPGMVATMAVCVTGSVTHTLKADGFDGSEDGTGRGQPIVAFNTRQDPIHSSSSMPLGAKDNGHGVLTPAMAVRRLLPVECHRLQGFPDDWCAVPTGPKGKIAADGPQYKQLGNSWAVNHAQWVGMRIAAWLQANPSRPCALLEFEYDERLLLWALAA